MAWIKGKIDPEMIEEMVRVIQVRPIHYADLARRIRRSESWVRFVAEGLIDEGRSSEIANLRSYRRGTAIEVPFVENLLHHRKVGTKGKAKPSVCRHCGLSGQLQGQSGGKKRTVCDSCQPEHDMKYPNADHTRTWRDDPRWVALIDRRHQEKDGCLVCGSSRAKLRDGRYCDWRHDPVMLTPEEFDALLERHSSVTRYDIWGNVLR